MSNDTPRPRKTAARLILALALAGIGATLAYRWWHGQHYVTTDNAQIEGRIVPVAPRVAGYVRTLAIADNQQVKAGDVLVQIDDRDYQARLQQAEAELAIAVDTAGKPAKGESVGQAMAQINVAQANAAAAASTIRQIEANLQKTRSDQDRVRSLAQQNMASAQQLEAAETAVRSAEAQLKAARDSASAAGEQVTLYSAALRSARAKVDAVQAQRELAAIQLADTRLLAPVSGMISKKQVEAGQLVQPAQTLFSIVASDDVWVVANVKETDIGKIKPGNPVSITVDAYPGQPLPGKVESVGGATGAKFALLPPDNATGNFTKVVQRVPVKIRLDSDARQRLPLRPGLSVFASIDIG